MGRGRLVCGLVGKWSVEGWSVGWWSMDLIKPLHELPFVPNKYFFLSKRNAFQWIFLKTEFDDRSYDFSGKHYVHH